MWTRLGAFGQDWVHLDFELNLDSFCSAVLGGYDARDLFDAEADSQDATFDDPFGHRIGEH